MPKLQVPAKQVNTLSMDQKKSLIKLINQEYTNAYTYIKPIWDRWDQYYEKYKNEIKSFRQEDFKLMDYTIFSIIQTMMGHLSLDTFDFHLKPTSKQDIESVMLLEKILRYDFERTKKQDVEDEWIWSTLFFGVSDLLLAEVGTYDAKSKYYAPMPRVMNQRVFLFDPHRLGGINSTDGGYQYAGYITQTTVREIKKYRDEGYYQYDDEEFYSIIYQNTEQSTDDLVYGYKKYNQENTRISGSTYDNYLNEGVNGDDQDKTNRPIYLLNWWRYDDDGDVTHIIMPLNRNTILRYEKTKFNKLPFITRELFKQHSVRNFYSVPYLTLAYQRGKQAVMNLALDNEIRNQQPLFLYEEGSIENPSLLTSPIGAAVPTKGMPGNVLERVQTNATSNSTDFVYNLILNAEQQSTGVTASQRGVSQGNVLATEVLAQSQSSNIKALLVLNNWITNEKSYIQQCIRLYDLMRSTDIYKKVVRIDGDVKDEFIDLSKREIKEKLGDVDVYVRNKELEKRKLQEEIPNIDRLVANSAVFEGTDKRQLLKVTAYKLGFSNDVIDKIYPPSPAEQVARSENIDLEQKQQVDAQVGEDHTTHLREHRMGESTPQLRRHIKQHMLLQEIELKDQQIQQEQAQLQAQQQQGAPAGPTGGVENNLAQSLTPNLNNVAAGTGSTPQTAAKPLNNNADITPTTSPLQ